MIWGRLKTLWKLSELAQERKFTWNGEPISKEGFESKIGYTVGSTPNQPAQFIPRHKENPIDKITKIGEENAA